MTPRPFKQVDVFTSERFKGNPVAVFLNAEDIQTEEMQSIARWTNLSETTFVLTPKSKNADYRLRIFTPVCELPFAGHPTIGSCYALLESKLIQPKDGKLIQECNAGLVEISVEGNIFQPKDLVLYFKMPYFYITRIDESVQAKLESALAISSGSVSSIEPPVLIEDGPKWLTVQLSDGASVLSLKPNYTAIAELSIYHGWTGIEVFGEYEDGSYESRSFAPAIGINEDPACGSGAGAIGAYLASVSEKKSKVFQVRQGRGIGRDATLQVSINIDSNTSIRVGGQAITCIDGNYDT